MCMYKMYTYVVMWIDVCLYVCIYIWQFTRDNMDLTVEYHRCPFPLPFHQPSRSSQIEPYRLVDSPCERLGSDPTRHAQKVIMKNWDRSIWPFREYWWFWSKSARCCAVILSPVHLFKERLSSSKRGSQVPQTRQTLPALNPLPVSRSVQNLLLLPHVRYRS